MWSGQGDERFEACRQYANKMLLLAHYCYHQQYPDALATTREVLQSAFDMCWHNLARGGSCDDFGGSEYRRVRSEWWARECPHSIDQFILEQANQPATPQQERVSNGN